MVLPLAVGVGVLPGTGVARAEAPTPATEGYTRTTHWVRNANGTVTASVYGAPVFTRRSGTWRHVDPRVSPSGSVQTPFGAPDAIRPMRFGSSADRLVAIDVGGGEVTLSSPGLAVGAPLLDGGSVRFREVAPDTDLVYETTLAGLRAKLVLRSAVAQRSFRFHLADPLGRLGGVEPTPDGGWRFTGSIEGDLRLHVAPGFAYPLLAEQQSPGVGVEPSSARMDISPAGDGFDIVKTVDEDWLAGQSFPVVLDPYLYFGHDPNGSPDCHMVSGSKATTNYCNGSAMEAGYLSSDGWIRRMILRFGLAGIPAGSRIDSASLGLALTARQGTTVAQTLDAYRVTNAWDNSATWNNRKSGIPWATAGGEYNGTVLGSASVGPNTGFYSIPVSTATVSSWLNDSTTNHGLLLRRRGESSANGVYRFATVEAGDFYTAPELTVVYSPPPAAPASVSATAGTERATVSWPAADTQGGSRVTEYRVTPACASTGCTVDTTPRVCAAPCASFTMALTGGHSYTFAVRAVNADGLVGPAATSAAVVVPANLPPATPDQLAPDDGTQVPAPPEVCAHYQDPNSDPGDLTFEVRVPSTGQVVLAPPAVRLSSGQTGCVDDDSLADGSYLWDVVADDDALTSPTSPSHSLVIDRTPPAAPAITSSTHSSGVWTANQNATMALTASDLSGIAGYSYVLGSATTTVPDTTIDTTASSLSLPNLPEGTSYLHVRAVNRVGLWSNAAQFTLRVDRAAPTGLAISSTSHPANTAKADPTADVTWTAASDSLSGLAGYSWAFSQSATTVPDTTIESGAATSATSAALSDGLWYFAVRAIDAVGNAGPAAVHGPFRVDTTLPAGPVVSSTTHTSGVWSPTSAASLSWTDAEDASGVVGYSYTFDSNASSVPDTTQDTATAAIGLSAPDGVRYFRVRAVDAAGNWGPTSGFTLQVDTVSPTAPGSPTGSHPVNGTTSDATVDMSWTAASDATSGVAGYSWLFSQNASPVPDATLDGTPTTTATTSGTLADGVWYFAVRAYDLAGHAGPLRTYGPFRVDTLAPAAPVVTSSSHTSEVWSPSTQASLSWQPPADPSGITGYSYSLTSDPSGTLDTTAEGSGTSLVLAVPEGVSYFRLRALDAAGNWGAVSIFVLKADSTAPAAPAVSSTTHPDPGGSWSPNNDPVVALASSDMSGIAGYAYLLDQNPDAVPGTSLQTAAHSISFAGLADGRWYLHVRAVNGSGLAGATSHYPLWVDRLAPTAPAIVTDTHEPGVMTNHRVLVADWTGTPATDALSGLAGYSVAVNSSEGTPADGSVDLAGTAYTSASLADGTWWLHVRGVDVAGNAGPDAVFGPIVIDATRGLPYPVDNVLATAGDQTAGVTWSPVDDNGSPALGYTVTAHPGGATLELGPTATGAGFTGLDNGTAYSFTVTARNANGSGLPSGPSLDVVPFGHVGPVADLRVEEVPFNAVRVSWLAPELNGDTNATFTVTLEPGGIRRDVELVHDEGDEGVVSDPADAPDSTDTTFTGLAPGLYTATVVATGTDGVVSAPVVSDSVAVRGTPPGTPGSLVVAPGDEQVALSWVPPTDGGSPITQYEIVVDGSEDTVRYVDATERSTIVTGLTNGTPHTFDVYATNELGRSGSGRAAATPTYSDMSIPEDPAAPRDVRATRGDRSARVTWTAPSVTAPGVTGYQVTTRRTDGTVVKTTSASDMSVTVTGLSNGVPAYFTVATMSGPVAGPESKPSNTVTPAGLPGTPTSVSAASVESAIRVTWAAPTANGDPIRNYLVQIYSTASGYVGERRVGVSPQTIGGLTYGQNYYVTVKAQNGVGVGSPSAASNTVTFRGVPAAPTNVSALQYNPTTLTASWTAADPRGSAVTKYVVTADPGGKSVTTAANATSAQVSGLKVGNTYRLRIAAYSALGRGKEAVTGSITLKDVPGSPGNVRATPGNAAATVTWAAANPRGAHVTSYVVFSSPATTSKTVSGDARSATLTELRNGTTYTLHVYARNSEGGGLSAASNAVTPSSPATSPSPPTRPPGGGTASGVRQRIARLAMEMDQNHRKIQESPYGSNCNWFTAQWPGRGSTSGQGGSNNKPCVDDPKAPTTGSKATRAEQWCADFAEWVWKAEGVDVSGTNAMANSFISWAQKHGTWHPAGSGYVPQPGDAAVWKITSGKSAGSGHVGIMVAYENDRDMWTVNGNSGPEHDGVGNIDTWYKRNPFLGASKGYYSGRGTFQGWASPVDAQGRVIA